MLLWRRRSLATKEQVLAEESIKVPAMAQDLAAMHTALDRFWAALDQVLAQPPDPRWRLLFATAVAEIGANIVRHAYGASTEPGTMHLRLRAYDDRVEALFTDQGVAFVAPPNVASALPADDPLALPEGGYGLAIARTAVDQLDYARTPDGRNQWRLVKRIRDA
jgi:serine/threonine-protein kinase RsbW